MAASLPPGDAAQPPPAITMEQAVSESLRTSPRVRAAEHSLRAAEAHLLGARAPLNPHAVLQHGAGRDAGGLDEDVSVVQVFELGGKRRYRAGEANQERLRAAAEVDAARLEVAYRARRAYLNLQELVAEVEQHRRFVRLAEQFQAAAAAQFQAGEAPRTRVLRSEIEVGARMQALEERLGALEERRAALNSLMGRPPGSLLVPAGALSEPPGPGPLETWLSAADTRPELIAARAELAARQYAVGAARAESRPDLFWSGIHADVRRWPGNAMVLGLAFPLWDRGSLRARRQEARYAVSEQEELLAESRREFELEVRASHIRAARAAARLKEYRSGQVEKAGLLVELARTGYEAGETGFLELLDAQRAYQELQLGYLRALAEAAEARLALERAAGRGAEP